jgi:chromosome segregation ATPase
MNEILPLFLIQNEEKYEKQIHFLQKKMFQFKEQIELFNGREEMYQKQIEHIEQEKNMFFYEKKRLEAEIKAQEKMIQHLKEEQLFILQKDNKDIIQEEKEEEKQDEFLKIKQEYERLMKEKEKQQAQMGLLTEECEQLRISKGQTCGCCIS